LSAENAGPLGLTTAGVQQTNIHINIRCPPLDTIDETLTYGPSYLALRRLSPGAVRLDLDPSDKVFSLQILVAQVVLTENPLDDIASPLGISSNMLIKAAITRNPFLPNIGGSEHARAMKMVSIHRFSR